MPRLLYVSITCWICCLLATGCGKDAIDKSQTPDIGENIFGDNVFVFDPTMSMSDIQDQIDRVFAQQEKEQFGESRYAFLFYPGQYDLDVKIGFYMHVAGLGYLPDDVHIRGGLRSTAD